MCICAGVEHMKSYSLETGSLSFTKIYLSVCVFVLSYKYPQKQEALGPPDTGAGN